MKNTLKEIIWQRTIELFYRERDKMEEKYSTDTNGELVMEEDLDDTSYPRLHYIQNTNYEA